MTALLPSRADLPWNAPRIAVLEITGAIGAQVRGPEMVRAIRALAEDRRVRAVVVEIDSPGGSASTSPTRSTAPSASSPTRKPVIAYVMNAGLSGGYLIACATHKIVALPTALVGSIGVIFMRPVVQELMEKVGVRMVMTHEGHLKGMFQPWREPSEEELKKVESLTDQYYDWFVDASPARATSTTTPSRLRHRRSLHRHRSQGQRPRRRARRPRDRPRHGQRDGQGAAPPALRPPPPPPPRAHPRPRWCIPGGRRDRPHRGPALPTHRLPLGLGPLVGARHAAQHPEPNPET